MIQTICPLISMYDPTQKIPMLGFGAQIPNWKYASHCFALNGNICKPEVKGVSEALQQYESVLRQISFYGPTYFAPIIKTIGEIASTIPNNYLVFVLLTDGVVNDMNNTIDEIVKCSLLPISIIIVGIGSEDFSNLRDTFSNSEMFYSQTGVKAKRALAQLISLQEHNSDTHKLVEQALKEIPAQFTEYAKIANIPLTPPIKTIEYCEMKKKKLIEKLTKMGGEADKLSGILSAGVPIEDDYYVLQSSNNTKYINPFAH